MTLLRRTARILLALSLAASSVTCGGDDATKPSDEPETLGITGAAGPAATLRVTRQPPATALDREVWTPGSQPVVLVKDANGVAVPGVAVTASVVSGPGVLEGTISATTKTNGSAT